MSAFNAQPPTLSQLDGAQQSLQIHGVRQPHQHTKGVGRGPEVLSTSSTIHTLCGPLLNYRRMTGTGTRGAKWHGSVLVVTTPGQQDPRLSLRPLRVPPHASAMDSFVDTPEPVQDGGRHTQPRDGSRNNNESWVRGKKLYEDSHAAFWRFLISLPLTSFTAQWQYHIPNLTYQSGASATNMATRNFYVPAYTESMRIMFHSCNGFSVGTDEDAWSGCALWNDVLRMHAENPLHVMIGGGDQIYNDSIRVSGPLRAWCDIRDPLKRQKYPFTEELRAQCDKHYLDNYIRWYATEPFATANGQIPQVNIWDDHDIIDGFGSYVDHFMKCAVFRGIGGVAHKYYLLFQHHVPPPPSTFTTDAAQTMDGSDPRPDLAQLQNSFVMSEKQTDPSYLIGPRPGPYVEERSRSIYCDLGAQVALLGIDARTERTRHQINYPDTYDFLFHHVSSQLAAANGRIKHFILLLGVPIAYPRLQWLENIFQSPFIGGIRLLNKRFGVAGGLFNNFDGQIDLLDDLDDHYTAHQHKKERKDLIIRLQKLAHQHNVRITILGGDVHLAAFGRFYSNPDLGIPAEHDHRYITNVVSSAITNHPPPTAVANLLARRNKIHHLDHETDETLLNLFDHDPGRVPGQESHQRNGNVVATHSAQNNHCTMPSRNYAILSLSNPSSDHTHANGTTNSRSDPRFDLSQKQHHNHSRKAGNPRNAQHAGEDGCGTAHPAASGTRPSGIGGPCALDVCYRVEIDQHDREGRTQGYGLTIPGLEVRELEKTEGHVGRGMDRAKDAAREAGEKV